MLTFDGICITPSNRAAPSLEAIALALGRTPRWRGQSTKFFPVLAHSFLTAELATHCLSAPALAADDPSWPHRQLHALLHDAGECVIGDIPTSWKDQIHRGDEHRLLLRIYAGLGIGDLLPLTPDLAQAVKDADALALRAEATVMMPASIGDHFPVCMRIYRDTESELLYAVEAARRWAACSMVYPDWLQLDGSYQQRYCSTVRGLVASVRRQAMAMRQGCPNCGVHLANDGSCCDRCGWVRPA